MDEINPNQEHVATFLIAFGAHMNILFIIKLEIDGLIKWSYRLPLIMLNVEFRLVIIF